MVEAVAKTANCSKNMDNCSKRKVVEPNCSKNMVIWLWRLSTRKTNCKRWWWWWWR